MPRRMKLLYISQSEEQGRECERVMARSNMGAKGRTYSESAKFV